METQILTDLDGLLDLIHDRFFDLTECEFDRETREFRLSRSDRGKGPYNQKLLKVTDVSDIAIRDEAQTQIYDLCDVKIGPSSVRILSCIPLEIVLTVGPACTIFILKHPQRMDSLRNHPASQHKGLLPSLSRIMRARVRESRKDDTSIY